MTFEEAKKKLKKIADGKYNRTLFSVVEYSTGSETTYCELYIDGMDIISGQTWAACFDILENKLEDMSGMEA